MLGYLQLLRPLNCLMAAIAVFIGGLLVMGGLEQPALNSISLAMLAAFLITGAGNTVNDYIDVEADKVNKPKRPIPSGRVSKGAALAYTAVLFAIGIILAGFTTGAAFALAIFNSIVLVAYPAYLQDKLLVGNISVSYLVGSTFLFGGAALGNITLPLVLMMLALFANLAREIVKDLEDMEGDKVSILKKLTNGAKRKAASILDRFGVGSGGMQLRHSHKLIAAAALSLALAIAVSPVPFLMGILGYSYLVMLVPTDLAFLACMFLLAQAPKRRGYKRISKGIKIGMFLGLIAFIVGVLI
jgi:geranylgeranylglycerol-phosphate geranylgeranyltransferase